MLGVELSFPVRDPLEEWRGCRRVPLSRAPGPRRLARWAEEERGAVALLESGAGFPERSRYTIVAVGAERIYTTLDPGQAYGALRSALRGSGCTSLPCRDLLFGVVGYEAVAGAEEWLAPRLGRHEWPPLLVFKPEALVVYDHLQGRALVCPGDAELGEREPPGREGFTAKGPVEETPARDFMDWVSRAKRMLEEGEFLQVVLSRYERYTYRGDPMALYVRLAGENPSPYMFYMNIRGYWIAGASPELLVKMDKGKLETHPIAGTRPRGATPEEDARLEEELLSDEKERAEHMMLVDLARNDLGAVAVPGTVRVTALMEVEKYSRVQHLVSRVEALADPRRSYADVLAAVNPAGTVSGAPKPRAMEVIAELEDRPRGPYAGAAGAYGGRAGETAIVIRSVWGIDEETLETRAGAGIVYDSVPRREYLETLHKLAAIHRALGLRPRVHEAETLLDKL